MGMIWKIAARDLLFMLKQRETQMWMFLMPLGFCAFFGFAFQDRGGGRTQRPTIAIANNDTGFASKAFIAELDSLGYNVVEESDPAELARYRRQVHVPPGFTDSLLAVEHSTVVFKHDLGDLNAQSDRIKVQRALWRLVGATAVAASRGAVTDISLMSAVDVDNPLDLEVSVSGRKKVIPSGFAQAVPGNLVMFVLLVAFTSGAITLVVERDQGLLRRLASAPLTKLQLLSGKALSRFLLAAVEILYFVLIGALIFGLDWGDNIGALLMVLFAYAVGASGLGLLLGTLGRSADQAAGLGVLSALLMAALGGAWWPIEIVPKFMQYVAFAFPTGWAMDGILKAMTMGNTAASLAVHTVVLLLFGLASLVIASRTFKYS
jgi:ABC-type multidrug transport system permease subunit